MRCPKCGNRDDKVIDSRQSRDNSSIRRRRVCLACAFRFTTYEEIERTDLRVIKRDRTHEAFDRRKLANSVAKACEKRSISLVTLEQTVDDIVHELETSGREVTVQYSLACEEAGCFRLFLPRIWSACIPARPGTLRPPYITGACIDIAGGVDKYL
jgi:transcriptional regulator NrdR